MARMRYVKPEFWTDSTMVALSRDARLFYIGTWNFALCDKGHLEDDAIRLKMQIFPADNVDVPGLLRELMQAGRIVRLEGADGSTWLQAKRLADHQKVDPRWTPRCPACKAAENLSQTQESFGEALTRGNAPNRAEIDGADVNLSHTPRNSPQEGIGGEGIGERKTRPSAAPPDTFEAWWAQYPRKEGKGQAVKAYRAALKVIGADELATLTVRWFADRPDLERRFTPLPASWLSAQRWADERPQEAKGATRSPWDRAARVSGES